MRLAVEITILYLLSFPMVTQAQIKPIKPFGKIRALIVGVSDYKHPKIEDLSYADRDAKAFAQFLEEETAWKAASEDIVLLTNEKATYGQFLAALESLTENAQANDRLIIYFSGHGDIEVVSEEKRGYLLFYDASPTTYASGGACMVNTLDAYISQLVLEKKTEVILISDACRSGSLAGSKIGGPKATTAALSALFINTVKMLSCEPDQFSVEDERWGNGRGLFSYYLVNGLRGLADENENLYVSKFEIENYLRKYVPEESDSKQIPVISGGSSSLRLSRVNADLLGKFQEVEAAPLAQASTPSRPDTSALNKFGKFEAALSQKQLLYPKASAAYTVYQSMGDDPQSQAFKKIMKISLISALQDEAQQALNEYITSPSKELAKRWANAEAYTNYPAYLDVAADLLGEDNYFYKDVKSRAHYFRGVNQRLIAQAEKMDEPDFFLAALAEQQKALQLQPIAPHIYNEMGLVYQRLKDNAKAIEYFQKACALSPTWGLALTNLAVAYQNSKAFKLAEQYFLQAIQADQELSLAHFNLGFLYEEMGDPVQAESAYRVAIEKTNPVPDAYYNLAYIEMEKQPAQNEKALGLLDQYLVLLPQDIDAYNLMAYIYGLEDRTEEAIEVLEKGLEKQPKDIYALNQLALYLEEFGDVEETINTWGRILEIDSSDQNAYLQVVRLYILKNDQKSALEFLERLLEIGYRDYTYLSTTIEYDQLRTNPIFQALLKKYFPDR